MPLLNGTPAGPITLSDALNRRLPYWELVITEWGKVNANGDMAAVENTFPNNSNVKIPSVRAIAISPLSTVDRVRAKILPVDPGVTLFAAGYEQQLDANEAEISVGRPWIAPATVAGIAGFAPPSTIILEASPGTQYSDLYVPYGSTAAAPFATSPAFEPPCLRVLFYFRDVPQVFPERVPLMSVGGMGQPVTMNGYLNSVAFLNGVESLVKVVPVMGRKKIRVSVSPIGAPGPNVNVRLGGVVSMRYLQPFGPFSTVTLEHQYMATTLATTAAPLTRYIDTDPVFPFLTVYLTGVASAGTAQVIIDAVD
jgi:hypothetical protein